MIEVIGEYVRESFLDNLSFADLVGGIAMPFKKAVGKNVEKVVPVWRQVGQQADCDSDDYIYLIPDAKRKSVVFLELESNNFVEFSNRYAEAKSIVNVICWINYHATSMHLYSPVPYQAEIMRVMSRIPNTITYTYPVSLEQSVVSAIRVVPLGDIIRSNIWNKYTLDEIKTQYGMYPYDYFGVKYEITYRFNANCYLDIIKKETDCVNHKIHNIKCESFEVEE